MRENCKRGANSRGLLSQCAVPQSLSLPHSRAVRFYSVHEDKKMKNFYFA